MKLQRWLVVILWTLIVLSCLAAFGWSWVTWPERTSGALLAAMADGELKTANHMMTNAKWEYSGTRWEFLLDGKRIPMAYPVPKVAKLTLKMEEPKRSDRMMGRRRLTFLAVNGIPEVWQESRLEFVVERNQVHCEMIPLGKGLKN